MTTTYEPWRCQHNKPFDVLELADDHPRAEWCMECGCARKEERDADDPGPDGFPRYRWGEWIRPSALNRWPGSPDKP